MRTIKKLLTIVRDNLYLMKNKNLVTGMCSIAYLISKHNIITQNEYNFILDYLNNHKPINAIKRAKMKFDNSEYNLNLFWWKPYVIAPRLKWLDKQINSL